MLQSPPDCQGWTTGDPSSSDITTFFFETYNEPRDGGPPPVLRLRIRMNDLGSTVDAIKKITEADIRSSWCGYVSLSFEGIASVHCRALPLKIPRSLEWQIGISKINLVDREMSFAWCDPMNEFAKRLRTVQFKRSILEDALGPSVGGAPVLVGGRRFPALVKSLRLA